MLIKDTIRKFTSDDRDEEKLADLDRRYSKLAAKMINSNSQSPSCREIKINASNNLLSDSNEPK